MRAGESPAQFYYIKTTEENTLVKSHSDFRCIFPKEKNNMEEIEMADVYTAVTSVPVGTPQLYPFLMGIATILFIGTTMYFLFRLFKAGFAQTDVNADYLNTERIALRRYLKGKKNINLDKEIAKINIKVESKFQKRLEKEVEEDFFGKEDEKED